MSRINTNVTSLLAQRNLASSNAQVNKSLERLSTGLRINRGSDDPAGLIASERMRSEKVALSTAISNSERATNLLGTAEGALNEINTLLLDIQGMVDMAANEGGMTTEEVAANQLMIDEAISSIDRIAATTQFNGKKLLDGTLGFNTNTVNAAQLSSVIVNQATFTGTTTAVTITAAATAEKGHCDQLAAEFALADGLVRIEGNKGVANVTFTALSNQAAVMAVVNAVSDVTGVVATADGANIDYDSAEYGLNQFVKFTALTGGTFGMAGGLSDYGLNATITEVNGSTTGVSVEGLNVTVKRANLDLEIAVVSTLAAQSTFNIEQGGAKFQIGAEINTNNQVAMGIRNVDTAYLGDAVNGMLNTLKTGGTNALSSTNFATAASVVSTAINQVSGLRGRIGAVQKNTLETAIRSLGATLENITSAESAIRDTDFAEETANMTRAQILVQAGTSVLAMANSAPQNVLALLQG